MAAECWEQIAKEHKKFFENVREPGFGDEGTGNVGGGKIFNFQFVPALPRILDFVGTIFNLGTKNWGGVKMDVAGAGGAVFEILRIFSKEETEAVFEGGEVGSGKNEGASWSQDAMNFGEESISVKKMFDNLEGDDEIDRI